MNESIAVIPARGGSKGVPGKNIIDLGGKPLIAYTIEAALQSDVIDRVVVSTDSEKIAEVAARLGAEVPFLRPAELATDSAHSADVVEHAVGFVEAAEKVAFKYVIMLQPTSPFRNARHITEAMRTFLDGPHESLITIKRQEYPPWWMFRLDGDRLTTAVTWKPGVNIFNMVRQDFPDVYRPNGAFYVTYREKLRESGNLINPNSCGYYIMATEDSVDIDTPADLAVARAEFSRRAGAAT